MVGTDTRMAVLVVNNNTVQIHSYVPNDDSDGDGVLNTADAFPLDRAASADTDRDGFPDAWNTGRTVADSTTGLALDAFPQDSACWLAAHGTGGTCNYAATIPNYVPDQVVQNGDTVYLLSSANRRVYRWSISAGAYLNPYIVGINQGFSTRGPDEDGVFERPPAAVPRLQHRRHPVHRRHGGTRPLKPRSPTRPWPWLASRPSAITCSLRTDSGAWATHYVINNAGVITDSEEWNHQSADYAWDPVTSRVYYFSMWSPADLNYEVIDQATGQITSAGETPYHGSYNIQPPIRVSRQRAIRPARQRRYLRAERTDVVRLPGRAGDGRALVYQRLPGHSDHREQPDDVATTRRHQPRNAGAAGVHGHGAARCRNGHANGGVWCRTPARCNSTSTFPMTTVMTMGW